MNPLSLTIHSHKKDKKISAPLSFSVVWPQAAAAHITGDPLVYPAGICLIR